MTSRGELLQHFGGVEGVTNKKGKLGMIRHDVPENRAVALQHTVHLLTNSKELMREYKQLVVDVRVHFHSSRPGLSAVLQVVLALFERAEGASNSRQFASFRDYFFQDKKGKATAAWNLLKQHVTASEEAEVKAIIMRWRALPGLMAVPSNADGIARLCALFDIPPAVAHVYDPPPLPPTSSTPSASRVPPPVSSHHPSRSKLPPKHQKHHLSSSPSPSSRPPPSKHIKREPPSNYSPPLDQRLGQLSVAPLPKPSALPAGYKHKQETPMEVDKCDELVHVPRDLDKAYSLAMRPGAGTRGQPMELISNCFRLQILVPSVFMYALEFLPDVETDSIIRDNVMRELRGTLQRQFGVFTYDNQRMLCLKESARDDEIFECRNQVHNLRVLKVDEFELDSDQLTTEERIQLLTILFREVTRKSHLKRVGRAYHELDPNPPLKHQSLKTMQNSSGSKIFDAGGGRGGGGRGRGRGRGRGGDRGRGYHQDDRRGYEDERQEYRLGQPIDVGRGRTIAPLLLWRGYVMSVDPSVGRLLHITVDPCFKTVSMLAVSDDIKRTLSRQRDTQRAHREIKQGIVGCFVLTPHNAQSYRVSDVDFSMNMQSTFFDRREDRHVTYEEYYQGKYVLSGLRPEHCMLVVRFKGSKRNPGGRVIHVPPQLCFKTGKPKEFQSNFRLNKSMADQTFVSANDRLAIARDKMKMLNANTTPDTPLRLAEQSTRVNARVLPSFRITLNSKHGQPITVDSNVLHNAGSLETAWRDSGYIKSSHNRNKKIERWMIVYAPCDKRHSGGVLDSIRKLATGHNVWGKTLSDHPELVEVSANRGDRHFNARRGGGGGGASKFDWENTIRAACTQGGRVQLMFCLFPDINNEEIYAAVKHLTITELGIPVQGLRPSKFKNRAHTIIGGAFQQAMTKCGFAPWKIDFRETMRFRGSSMDLNKPTMFVGIDKNHSKENDFTSVAFVASTDPDCTHFLSFPTTQAKGTDIIQDAGRLMEMALEGYRTANSFLPQQVVVFRNGVSDSQLKAVRDHEVTAFERVLHSDLNPGWRAQLCVIVVQSSTIRRFYKECGSAGGARGRNWHSHGASSSSSGGRRRSDRDDRGHGRHQEGDGHRPVETAPVGAVVDSGVVSGDYWDFYLFATEPPRTGGRQATANPTRYIVLYKDKGLPWGQNEVEELCRQMCHLYFNWPGPIRMPIACKIADRVACLFGNILRTDRPMVADALRGSQFAI